MRILISSEHRYPSEGCTGAGRHPRAFPSGSANHMLDLTAKGLAEMGHEVILLLPDGWDELPPWPATMTRKPTCDVDVAHLMAYRDDDLGRWLGRNNVPSVVNCHRDPQLVGKDRGVTGDNWIYVSRSLAEAFNSNRYVLNGLDPADYLSADTKRDYLLFMAALEWAEAKGLELALSLAQEAGIKLVVAGTGQTEEIIAHFAALCQAHGAEFVGDVRGREKAALFASAKAFLFPTKVPESFGLCMAEALFSGVPVITSNLGACPEIVTPDVGFVCESRNDYLAAIDNCDDILPAVCRAKAEDRFHYRRMAADYAKEYQVEIDRAAGA